jgi:hypothetical protein
MLRDKGVAFLTKQQLQEASTAPLRRWLNGAPDLLVFGKRVSKTGVCIVDVHIGGAVLRGAKSAFKNSVASGLCEPVVVLHPHNVCDALIDFAGGVFSQSDVDYFQHNFAAFRTEAQHWRSSVKTSRMLRNDRHNRDSVQLKDLSVHPKLEERQATWHTKILGWAQEDFAKLDGTDDVDDE